MKIAGVVVLYNSPITYLQNINTYLHQIDKLFVLDNSEHENKELIDELKKSPTIQYISNAGNQGIAHALNRGAEHAIQEGYSFLLTMDDDSMAPANMVAEMKKFISSYAHPDQIGIVSATHLPTTIQAGVPSFVLYTMTSGNLLNLKTYQIVGPFREDLFIDHVDHEYDLRLNSAGYSIVELPSVILNHPLGERKKQWGVSYISHQPLRQYYMVRNGILVAKQYFYRYPVFSSLIISLIAKEWIKIFFWQNKRRQRIMFMIKGLRDGFLGRSGKL